MKLLIASDGEKLKSQLSWLLDNAFITTTGDYKAFYKDIYIIANSPAQMHEMLKLIW